MRIRCRYDFSFEMEREIPPDGLDRIRAFILAGLRETVHQAHPGEEIFINGGATLHTSFTYAKPLKKLKAKRGVQ